MKQDSLNTNNIYAIPVGRYFEVEDSKCLLVYAPLANQFFLSTPDEVERLEALIDKGGQDDAVLQKLMNQSALPDSTPEVSEDTF